MNKYKAGVVGLGNIGFKYDLDKRRKGIAGIGTKTHVSAYSENENFILSGVVEINKETRELFKAKYPKVPVYKSVSELMLDQRPDFISVCTSTTTHCKIVEEIINYPVKGILCEKPIADSPEDARKIIELCHEKKIILTVNHGRRWHGLFLKAQKIIENNEIGQIRSIIAIYSGEVFNIGTHLFDAIRMLVQKDAVCLSGCFVSEKDAVDPNLSGWIIFEDNIHCSVQTNGSRYDMIFEIDLIGSQGRLKILNNGSSIELFKFEESNIYHGFKEQKIANTPAVKNTDVLKLAVLENVGIYEGARDNSVCSGYDGYQALEISSSLLESAKRKGEPRTLK